MVRTRGTVVEPAVGRDNGSRQGDVLSAQRGVAFVEGKEYRMMLGRTAGCSERCCLGWAKKTARGGTRTAGARNSLAGRLFLAVSC